MVEKQRTIKRSISMTGIGLHTGNTCTMTFKPAPPDHGIRFVRVDLPGAPSVIADIDHVVDISRGTTLQNGEAKVYTVEHVLAAFAGLQLDNMMVELDNNEPPVGDGSAKPYVDAIARSGNRESGSVTRSISKLTGRCRTARKIAGSTWW